MSRVTGFIEYLESHVGDMYVWGAQGQQVDSMSDPYAWIERRETSDVNYNRAVKFMEKAENGLSMRSTVPASSYTTSAT